MARAYLFTGKKHSVYGIMGTVFGALSLITLIICVNESYKSAGEQVSRLGASAVLGILFMVIGIVLSIKSLFETQRFSFFKVTGIILAVLSFAMISVILYAAAFM